MNVDLIFKIAAIGILVAVLDQLLVRSGREEQAMLEDRSLEETEAEMEKILSRIDGVGQLKLMLTVESGPGRQLAADTELSYSGQTAAPDDYTRKTDTVVVSQDGGEEPVVTGSTGAVYRGALVVCQGADSAKVKLAVTSSVSALTGLGSDRITVVKCQ